ncbi:MAG: VOC family protein [Pseudomonadota bacterium]
MIAKALSTVLATTLCALPIAADPIPGMRGVDHIGLTVPDMEQAVTFFSDVLGCETATSFGPFRDDEGGFMTDLLDVHPRAVIHQITLMRCGFGANIELFDYDAPDQETVRPRNSDIGGHHIAIYVDNIAVAAEYLHENGIRTLMGPFPVNDGPAAGQTVLYFFAPWGLQMELISYPGGMAYETEGGPVLWSPSQPAN